MAVSSRIRLGIATLAVIVLVVAARMLPLAQGLEWFSSFVQNMGVAGMMLYALAYAVATVLILPGSLLTLAAGAVFGLLPGFVTVLHGATLGAALAFLVSRHLARERVQIWIQKKAVFSAVDKAVAREGWKIVFLTRLSPVFPFNLQNYGYGLTRIPFGQYALASWVGMIPGAFLYVYLGAVGRSGLEAATTSGGVHSLRLALEAVGLLATLAVAVLITRTARKALRNAGVE